MTAARGPIQPVSAETHRYPHIIYRDSPVGKVAQIGGTRLQVWEIVSIWHAMDHDVQAMSEKYGVDCALVDEALQYAEEHPAEIETITRYCEEFDSAKLERVLSAALVSAD